jgi:hypothetical protein
VLDISRLCIYDSGMTTLHPNQHILVDSAGKVQVYAWPGGYPIFYITGDGGALCPQCVEENLRLCASDEKQWKVIAHEANWEDPSLYCDHCGRRIESAYAEEEEEVE